MPHHRVILSELFHSVFGHKSARQTAQKATEPVVGIANAPDVVVVPGSLFG